MRSQIYTRTKLSSEIAAAGMFKVYACAAIPSGKPACIYVHIREYVMSIVVLTSVTSTKAAAALSGKPACPYVCMCTHLMCTS